MIDMGAPGQFERSVENVKRVHDLASPETARKGKDWYGTVHEAVSKGIKGTSLDIHRGAGVVAAVSPNMDWEKRNIDAFHEIKHLKPADWAAIHTSAASKIGRTPEAEDVLKGLSISAATDSGLVKAHRLIQGEDVDSVLRRQTAPKTNAFAHNIAEPDHAGHVTIDGRAHDIAANRLQGWTQQRGIGSAGLKTGKTTRYEHFENAYRTAAGERGVLPHEMQAITWEQGKTMERAGTTKAGTPRKVGVRRAGQPYV
jgi:hypothetical protein